MSAGIPPGLGDMWSQLRLNPLLQTPLQHFLNLLLYHIEQEEQRHTDDDTVLKIATKEAIKEFLK